MKNKLQKNIDRALSQSIGSQLAWLSVAVVVVFGLLLLARCVISGAESLDFRDSILHFINPGTSYNSQPDDADKIWALIIGLFGMIFMSGLLISVFNNILARRVEKIQNGKVYYSFENHIVIIGFDKMSIGLVKQLSEKGNEIVLQTVQPIPQVRHELFSNLSPDIEKKVTLISGNRTSIDDLQKLRIDQCAEIFILGENEEYDNDSINIECLKKIAEILPEQKQRISCHVLFEYQSTFAVFQQQDIDLKGKIDFVPFNYYETWAQKVWVDAPGEYAPLDHAPITADSNKHVHLVVLGMSSMGVAMGIQAAHICHFPNFVTKCIKTRITFISDDADREMNFLLGRYRHLFEEIDYIYRDIDNKNNNFANPVTKRKFTDIEFEFVKARVENPAIQQYLKELSAQKDCYLTIAVCFSYPPAAIAAGLYLPDEVYQSNAHILIQQETSYSTVNLLAHQQGIFQKHKNVKPFGMPDNCYNLKYADDLLPMQVNYVYDYYYHNKKIPDNIPVSEISTLWDRLITAHKWSNRYNANTIEIKKRSFAIQTDTVLDDEQIDLMAEVEHNRWNIEKLLMGYRATSRQEKKEIASDKSKKEEYKKMFVHNDICAYKDLQDDATGSNANEYDRCISAALPLIIKTNVSTISDSAFSRSSFCRFAE
ncbi:hypothetical protein AGMMS50239_29060 [Bacteroidia bacterium]|nr:hypothetical protein AGMMS50239_29060 [Bacteroidia bacterium]